MVYARIFSIITLACCVLHSGQIHDAVLLRDFELVKRTIKARPKSVNELEEDSLNTPLHMSVKKCLGYTNASGVEKDVDLVDLEILTYLLGHGADCHLKNARGISPLDMANSINNDGFSALHYSAGHGYINRVKFLLLIGVDVDVASNNKTTPLMLASVEGKHDIVEVLLKHGANPNLMNKSGATAWRAAREKRFVDICNMFRQYGFRDTQDVTSSSSADFVTVSADTSGAIPWGSVNYFKLENLTGSWTEESPGNIAERGHTSGYGINIHPGYNKRIGGKYRYRVEFSNNVATSGVISISGQKKSVKIEFNHDGTVNRILEY